MIDTGAFFSLAGDEWVERSGLIAKEYGQGIMMEQLDRKFSIEGVGKSANEVTHRATVPIALATGNTGTFTTNVVRQSPLPGLLGLEPMIKQHTLLDLHTGRMICVGEGGYKLDLSPGSTVHKLERARSGHLILPTTEWDKVKKSTQPHVSLLTM